MNVMSWANLRGVERDPQQHEDQMLRRTVCSMLVLFAASAEAQIGRQRVTYPSEPDYWVGLSIGYLNGTTLSDDATGATWMFGYTSQIRATIEKTLSRGVAMGLGAGFATAPLTYEPGNTFNSACFEACQATADITQYVAFIRGGGAEGFHPTFELEGGVTQFSNFRDKLTDSQLPSRGAYDLTFGLGAGYEYGFSRTTAIYADWTYDLVLHRQSSASTNQTAPRLFAFRGGFRVGF
jgi:hypothetical protein